MWNFISQLGIARIVVDLTNEFSPLLIGLVSLIWLSAAMILCIALQHYLPHKTKLEADMESGSFLEPQDYTEEKHIDVKPRLVQSHR